MMPAAPHSPVIGYLVSAGIVLLVLALRWRRLRSARPLRLETLWILPAIYLAFAIGLFAARPPTPLAWGWTGVALALGSGIGWQRGRMMRIEIDPDTHALSQRASPAAFLLLLAILVARHGARYEFGGGHATMIATDMLLGFGLGMIATTRIEMALRARALLRATRS